MGAPKLLTMDWKSPDYDAIFSQRIENLRRLREHPERLPALKDYYRDHPADFISDWGVTFDPRNADVDLPTKIPFILFPRQREWIDWLLERWRKREPGICEKSRDMGISWLGMSLSATLCLFMEGIAIGVGSRKGEYVDKIGTMKPLLPKARMFLENLPVEFKGDWEAWRDAPFMRITFPATGSIIAGEGGDDIGRGDRTTYYLVDEAQPLDAKIITPHGYRLMADMVPGSIVIGRDGSPQRVTHVKDCGVHDVLRFTFSDGTFVECSPNHLWTVNKASGRQKVITLRAHEIANRYVYHSPGGQTQYRYRVPTCGPVTFAVAGELPLHPYIVGALLGDGSVKGGTIRIATADAEIVETFRQLLPIGVVIGAFDGRHSYNIVDRMGRQGRGGGGVYIRSRARLAVMDAGISGHGAATKFIPNKYKFAAPADRLSLLQGLMDTDGSATAGTSSFYSTSLRLAEDVRFLAQSLGGSATLNIKPDHRGYKSIYAVHIMLPDGLPPFRLARKLSKLRKRLHPPHRTIVAVAHVGRRPVRCITVEAKDGLYLTDNFVVTHNSAHLERPDLVEASLSMTTNCRIDMSSVKGMNNPFAQKRHSGKIDVFVFDWKSDPRKDDEWYAKKCEELDPLVVAQEIDRDYQASVSGIVIPGIWVRAAVGALEKLGIAPTGERTLALDVADEGVDKNAACGATGTEIDFLEEWSGKGADIFDTVGRTFLTCDERGYSKFRYDADGLGAGVRGDARILNEQRQARGQKGVMALAFRGSDAVVDPDAPVYPGRDLGTDARTNRDYFANRKAQGWWEFRSRFQKTYRWVVEGKACAPDDIISIRKDLPLRDRLVTELSQPTYSVNGVGKIVINKKPDGMKSPNLGDAAMIRFARLGKQALVVTPAVLATVMRAPPRRQY